MKDSEKYRQDLLKKVKQDPIHLDTDGEMWEKVWNRISDEKPAKKNHFIWYASAAAIFICLVAGVLVYFISNPTSQVAVNEPSGKSITKPEQDRIIVQDQEKVNPSKKNDYESEKKSGQEIGEPAPMEKKTELSTGKELLSQSLSDGSTVTLNSFTSLNVTEVSEADFASNLSGEAYFEIKPDKKRSFKVSFGNSYLMVIGTKFNVRNIKDEPYQQVAVTEGIVRVYLNKSEKGIEVKSGELLKISLNKNDSHLTKIDPLHYIAWKTGKLTFKKTPMEEVASALERVYKVNVMVDGTVKECTFTGDLSQTPLEEALQIIEATTSLKIKRTKDNVHISGSPCN